MPRLPLLAAAGTFFVALVLPSLAATADTIPVKPFSTTTVFFVTDQRPSAKGEAAYGFDDDRYTFDIGPCADPRASWSDDCGLHYGYVQWDAANKPYYTALSADDFYAAIGKPARALIFLHGFNERFSKAIVDGREFAGSLDYETGERGDVPVIVYGWPASASTFSRATFAAAYPNDETNNAWSRLHLLAFFRAFRRWSPGTRLSIVAHSLGNRLALDMLFSLRQEQLAAQMPLPPGVANYAPAYRVAHLISLEPDVDTETYAESIAVLQQDTVEDVTVYGNPNDSALGLSEHVHGHCRAGLIYCEPLYAGQFSGDLMPPWLNVIDVQLLAHACNPAFQHTYYRNSALLLTDVSGLVLDRTKLMTKDSLRDHMHYSDHVLSGKPIPHFWIDATSCV
jgi:esterase/lipase superfamily enzyme